MKQPEKPPAKPPLVFHATNVKCPNCEITLLDIEVKEQCCYLCGWSKKGETLKDKRLGGRSSG